MTRRYYSNGVLDTGEQLIAGVNDIKLKISLANLYKKNKMKPIGYLGAREKLRSKYHVRLPLNTLK